MSRKTILKKIRSKVRWAVGLFKGPSASSGSNEGGTTSGRIPLKYSKWVRKDESLGLSSQLTKELRNILDKWFSHAFHVFPLMKFALLSVDAKRVDRTTSLGPGSCIFNRKLERKTSRSIGCLVGLKQHKRE